MGTRLSFVGLGFCGSSGYNDHMATLIDSKMAQQYGVKHTRVLQRELQKLQSDCEKWVTIHPDCKGKSIEVPFIGKNSMRARTSRDEDIVSNEMKFGNIHMFPRSFYNATNFCNDDKLYNNNIDFTIANIVQEDRAAIARTKDEVILGVGIDSDEGSPTYGEYIKLNASTMPASVYDAAGGILGTNYMGVTGTTLHELGDTDTGDEKTTHVVPVDFKYSGTKSDTGIMLEKIVRAVELLKKRRAYVKGLNTCVVGLTARQVAEIQLWEQAQNKNYGFGDLVDGYRNRILGVNIMETDCLPVTQLAAGKIARICPVWVKEHVMFGAWQDAEVRVDANLQTKVALGQVVTTCAMGATRRQMDSVIQIQCLETLAS